ncbi:MAG: hypothetical protein JJ953_01535 [Gracilimonas sp.]|uniref:hypothetical protein n=1 Tax=Gracilimonas sp. TaxID=1974203 RepID=UPI001B2F6692|nr:hypothetical protein [Gracilimonas sp.]MBO6584765.1 hypothetical protein [Gracilimonas sp.]MBO6615964.1 hypothetical protein [Gracilimonas sp.]
MLKSILSILLLVLSCQIAFAQDIEEFWWGVTDKCFAGLNINKNNSQFMSMANKNGTLDVWDIEKKWFSGKISNPNLRYSYETLKEEIPEFPLKVDSTSTSPGCDFTIDNSISYELEIFATLVDSQKMGSINADIFTLLKNNTSTVVKLNEWWFGRVSLGEIENALEDSPNNKYVKDIISKKNRFFRASSVRRFIATTSVSIKGIEASLKFDEDNINRIKAIVESNQAAFIEAGFNFEFTSNTQLTFVHEYDSIFIPFLKFSYYKEDGVVGFTGNEDGLVDADFEEF